MGQGVKRTQRDYSLTFKLALMSQKAQFFEAMIYVLKNEYGVSIVKKATRQVERLTIVWACLFLGISRQAYYKRNRVADLRQGPQVVRFVRQVRLRQPRVGTRKLHYLLQGQDDGWLKVWRDRLFQILAEHRLLVQPRRVYHKTIHSFHHIYRYPNLLKAGSRLRRWPRSKCGSPTLLFCKPGAVRW